MNKSYIILSGAIKNVGDFLIFDRSKKLLKKFVSENLIEYNRQKPLDDILDVVNSSRGIIICGGPGFGENAYPIIYPLVRNLKDLRVPITTLGVGWSGKHVNEISKFKFTEKTKEFLNYVEQSSNYFSCRDIATERILKTSGYNKVLMTGCPVWYDIEKLNCNFETKEETKKIVFTTPADIRLIGQVIRVINLLKEKFPDSEIVASYHRGINKDKYTSHSAALSYNLSAKYAKLKGLKVIDVSYNLDKIDFYKDCDLHIGYRVHAHLYFLSKRLPSILISEDGRGVGMSETFSLPVINISDKNMIKNLSKYIDISKGCDFENMSHSAKYIDDKFTIMSNFLNYLKDKV